MQFRLQNAVERLQRVPWQSFIVLVSCCALSVAVRVPYRSQFFAADDMDFLFEIGAMQCGRGSYWLLFGPEGPHIMGLWKALFTAEWWAFGVDPVKFHVTIAVIQGLTATALFSFARAWGINGAGSTIMALSWAAAAMGGPDNPTLWFIGGMVPVALFIVLIAMRCVLNGRYSERWHWPIAMGLLLGLAILVWSDSLIFAITLMAELFAIGMAGRQWTRTRRWLIAWITPCIVIGLPTALLVIICMTWGATHGTRLQDIGIQRVLLGPADQMAIALGSLTYGDVAFPDAALTLGIAPPVFPQEALFPKFLLVAAVLAITVFLRRHIHWRMLAVLACLAFSYLLAADLAGHALSFHDMINHGHYLYFACLLWCVIFGCIGDALARILPRGSTLVVLAFLAILPLFYRHQIAVARRAAEIHAFMFRGQTAFFQDTTRVLEALSDQAATAGETLRLPDTPTLLIATTYRYWPLKIFAASCFPKGLPRVEILDPERVEAIDIVLAKDRLRQINSTAARALKSQMSPIYTLLQSLQWLSERIDALKRRIDVPNVEIELVGHSTPLNDVWAYGLAHPSPYADLANDPIRRGRIDLKGDFPEIWRLLHESDTTEARYLQKLFEDRR